MIDPTSRGRDTLTRSRDVLQPAKQQNTPSHNINKRDTNHDCVSPPGTPERLNVSFGGSFSRHAIPTPADPAPPSTNSTHPAPRRPAHPQESDTHHPAIDPNRSADTDPNKTENASADPGTQIHATPNHSPRSTSDKSDIASRPIAQPPMFLPMTFLLPSFSDHPSLSLHTHL